jgi:prevent-host-death family protein
MKSFSFSDLNRQSGEVVNAALAGPVLLTKRGKPKLVVMPFEIFELLASGRRAFTLEDAPESVNAMLVSAVDDVLGKDAPCSK